MSDHAFFPRFYQLCRSRGTSPNAVARELGIPSGSVTAWKQGTAPRAKSLQKLAGYFGVSVDYLLGNEPPQVLTDEDLKFALFGGDGPISDEMLAEVKQFAQFLKTKNQ